MTFDFSDFAVLAADLGEVRAKTTPFLRAAVEVTARRTKDAWNGRLYTEGHASRTGRSVSYDLSRFSGFGVDVVEAEIGPLKGTGRQAGVVALLENGSVHNAPHGYGAAALHENEADFEAGVAQAIVDAVAAAGI